ncbi:MAG: hypothetical protein WAK93_08045 [Solirubrobacteraceae bacterium]
MNKNSIKTPKFDRRKTSEQKSAAVKRTPILRRWSVAELLANALAAQPDGFSH